MKPRATLFALSALLLILCPLAAHAQIAVDGVLDEAAYQPLAQKQNENAGFGDAIDVQEIVYAVSVSDDDATNDTLYLGIRGRLDTSNDNAIGF